MTAPNKLLLALAMPFALIAGPALANATTALPPPGVGDILAHTPIWVWAVFAGLIWLGLSRTRDRDTGIGSLMVLPVIVLALAGYGAITSGVDATALAGLGIGGLLGLALAFLLERRFPTAALGNGRLRLTGDWSSLGGIVTIFAVHYLGAVAAAVHIPVLDNDIFRVASAILSDMFAIMLLARAILRLRLAMSPAAGLLVRPEGRA